MIASFIGAAVVSAGIAFGVVIGASLALTFVLGIAALLSKRTKP